MWPDNDELDRWQMDWVREWHEVVPEATPSPVDFHSLLLSLCLHNFLLWHEEDKARDPDADDHTIATVKRTIDGLNQRRNDAIEAIDLSLINMLPEVPESIPLHSETPGSLFDRLFISALKIYHMAEAAEWAADDKAQREKNLSRLAMLREQRRDLLTCLAELNDAMTAGRRRFKVYRQMKMYNDPELNPVLYRKSYL